MVKLNVTCKFSTIYNVSLIVLKHYLLEFNWYRAITQCTHHVNVLTTKLGTKSLSVMPCSSYAEEHGIPRVVAKRLDGSRCHLVKR